MIPAFHFQKRVILRSGVEVQHPPSLSGREKCCDNIIKHYRFAYQMSASRSLALPAIVRLVKAVGRVLGTYHRRRALTLAPVCASKYAPECSCQFAQAHPHLACPLLLVVAAECCGASRRGRVARRFAYVHVEHDGRNRRRRIAEPGAQNVESCRGGRVSWATKTPFQKRVLAFFP